MIRWHVLAIFRIQLVEFEADHEVCSFFPEHGNQVGRRFTKARFSLNTTIITAAHIKLNLQQFMVVS